MQGSVVCYVCKYSTARGAAHILLVGSERWGDLLLAVSLISKG